MLRALKEMQALHPVPSGEEDGVKASFHHFYITLLILHGP